MHFVQIDPDEQVIQVDGHALQVAADK